MKCLYFSFPFSPCAHSLPLPAMLAKLTVQPVLPFCSKCITACLAGGSLLIARQGMPKYNVQPTGGQVNITES